MATEPTDTAACCSHKHQRDLLAEALGRILVAAGGATEQPLTGPQLLLLADDYVEHLTGVRPTTESAATARPCISCGRPRAECRMPKQPFLSCCAACASNDGDTHNGTQGRFGPVPSTPGKVKRVR